MLHPSVKIISVLFLAIAVNVAGYVTLSVMAVVLVVLLFGYRVAEFLRMLRRVRWILLSLLLVYAFSTPGEYIAAWPFEWLSPTYEGIKAAALQIARLGVMLAGLSILLATTDRKNLIAGFYMLLRPLRHIGIQPERFAARLMLTLHYVEHSSKQDTPQSFRQSFALQHDEAELAAPRLVELHLPSLSWRDVTLLALLLAMGAYLL